MGNDCEISAQMRRKLMRTYIKTIAVGLALIGMVESREVRAANDGTEGLTSTGDTTITLAIDEVVKITKIGDLALTSPLYDGVASEITAEDDVCVYSNMDTDNGSAHSYSVTMTGDGTGSTFKVTCTSGDCSVGGNDEIDYGAWWNDVSATNAGETQVGSTGGASDVVASQTGWSNSLNCGGVGNTNARVRVKFAKNDLLDERRAGNYSGILTILITPTP
jgi:hypothetical protein